MIKVNIIGFMVATIFAKCIFAQPADTQKITVVNCTENVIENEIQFRTHDSNYKPIPDVTIILVGSNGKLIDSLKSNDNGIARKKIKAAIDERFRSKFGVNSVPRITISAIALKKGYRETVLFEASFTRIETNQNIQMFPIVEGERNEPMVLKGNIHHMKVKLRNYCPC